MAFGKEEITGRNLFWGRVRISKLSLGVKKESRKRKIIQTEIIQTGK